MNYSCRILLLVAFFLFGQILPAMSAEEETTKELDQEIEAVNPLELIEEHLGDAYSWSVLGLHIKSLTIPLPVIVKNRETNKWSVFSSAHLADGNTYKGYRIATEGDNAGKIVVQSANQTWVRPLDLSFTRNAAALFVSGLLLCSLLLRMRRFYKRNPLQMPRRLFGALEILIQMLVNEVIKPCLGSHDRKYTPYLLSLFFFILTINLLGLIVVFPGGVNLAGNISICLVLAACTLVLTLIGPTRYYWREIFVPDVPVWLNTPIPLMTAVEVFGIFTKPMALMVRMFANMFGGHVILIVLASLIFIFAPLGVAIASGVSIFVVLFSVFMLLIEVLVCFIQAYVFLMLSSLFIGLTKVEHR